MPKPHRHHKTPHKSTTTAWQHCISPAACNANQFRLIAHGDIIQRDICGCGATREAEINGCYANYGQWIDANA